MASQQTSRPANPNALANDIALFGDLTDKVGGALGNGAKALGFVNEKFTIHAADRAFRGYTVASPALITPLVNEAGNLRGMITSASWRHVFDVHIQYANVIERAGKVADFMAWANYLSGWAEQIRETSTSQQPWDVKGPNLCLYGTTALAKLLIGTAHGITDGMIYAAEGACYVGRGLGVRGTPTVSQCSNYADIARAGIGVAFKQEEDFFSPDNLRTGMIERGGAALAAASDTYDGAKDYLHHRFK